MSTRDYLSRRAAMLALFSGPVAAEAVRENTEHIDEARRAIRGKEALETAGGQPYLPPLLHAKINIAAAGTSVLIQCPAGSIIEVYEVFLYNATLQDIEIQDASGYSFTGPLSSFPGPGAVVLINVGEPHWVTQPDADLQISTSGATQVSGMLLYRVVGG